MRTFLFFRIRLLAQVLERWFRRAKCFHHVPHRPWWWEWVWVSGIFRFLSSHREELRRTAFWHLPCTLSRHFRWGIRARSFPLCRSRSARPQWPLGREWPTSSWVRCWKWHPRIFPQSDSTLGLCKVFLAEGSRRKLKFGLWRSSPVRRPQWNIRHALCRDIHVFGRENCNRFWLKYFSSHYLFCFYLVEYSCRCLWDIFPK